MRRLGIVTVIILWNLSQNSVAQTTFTGARASGMGNAFVTHQDEWAVFGNIGGMGKVQSVTALFAYQNRYGLADGFHSVGAGIIIPTSIGNGSLSAYRFGDELFSQQKLSLGWAHQINRMGVGARINYFQHHAEGYGTRANLVLDVGGVATIIPRLAFGLNITNVNQAKLSEEERIPTVVQAGLAYHPVKTLLFIVETEKDVAYEAVFKLGMEYKIIEKLSLRTGISTHPVQMHYGMGFNLKKFKIDYALITHPQLGFSNQLSVSYRLKNPKTQSLNPNP